MTGCKNAPESDGIAVNFSATTTPGMCIEKIVPLETRDDALVGRNFSLIITDIHYLVGDKDKIIVYNKDGSIFNVLSPRGKGPIESPDITAFSADDNIIRIVDYTRGRLLEYQPDGRFVGTRHLELPSPVMEFFGDLMLFDSQNRKTDKGNVLIVADTTGKVLNESISCFGQGVNYGAHKFQVTERYTLYLPSHHYTIYRVDHDGAVSPYISFDFGNRAADPAEIDKYARPDDFFAYWKHLKSEDKVGFLNFREAYPWILLNFEKGDHTYNWLYNQETASQRMVRINDENNNNSVWSYTAIGVEKNNFVGTVQNFV